MRTKLTFCNAAAAPTAPRVQEDPGAGEAELRALMIMAAHDLKNPLAAITAYVEVLRTEYGDLDEDLPHFLDAIERGLGRMTRLTQELMDYARADRELDPRRSSLTDLVGEIVGDHAAGPGAARVTVPDALPDVVADTGLLRHVLDNLIGNAVKYTPAGAVPEIEIRAFDLAGGGTRVEVADRGIGIPAAEQPKVFDAFHRCANSGGYSGTGLGLHICRRIIERHGGLIGVESNAGGGSRFWFTLPPAPVATDPQERAGTAPGR
jgi:signal transduction histidine kinase